jgi:hypothetical protein
VCDFVKAKKKPRGNEVGGKGYILQGIPSWILSLLKSAEVHKKMGPKSRMRAFPIVIYPDDLFLKKSKSYQIVNFSNRKNNPDGYRFSHKDICPKYSRLDDDNFKDFSRQLSAKYSLELGGSRLVPVLLPNDVITGKVLPYKFKSKKELILAGQTSYNPKKPEDTMFFLDDVMPVIHHNYINRYRIMVYHTMVLIGDTPSLVYTKHKLPEGKTFDFVVTKWYIPQPDREDKPVYYAWDMNEIVERFDDVYKVAGNVKCWNDITPNWGYDEETISILLIGAMFIEENVPALNVVLFGNPRLGKTRMLDVFREVFDEVVNIGSQQTLKGLTGGFWEEGKEGGMLSSNYVCLVDELFRTGLTSMSRVPGTDHISNLLNDTLELLEHKKSTARSGKFDRVIFFDKSFIATNNIKDTGFLKDSFKYDPAPHNRITCIKIPDSVEEEMRKVFIPPNRFNQMFRDRINKVGLNTKSYRKLFMLMRKCLSSVELDNKKVFDYLKQCDSINASWDRREKLYALVKGFAIFNHLFRESNPFPLQGKIIANDMDYMQAVNALNRIIRDTKNLLGMSLTGPSQPVQSNLKPILK